MIKIIAEASVPFLRGVAEQYADIEYIDNKDITAERIHTADALHSHSHSRYRPYRC